MNNRSKEADLKLEEMSRWFRAILDPQTPEERAENRQYRVG